MKTKKKKEHIRLKIDTLILLGIGLSWSGFLICFGIVLSEAMLIYL